MSDFKRWWHNMLSYGGIAPQRPDIASAQLAWMVQEAEIQRLHRIIERKNERIRVLEAK